MNKIKLFLALLVISSLLFAQNNVSQKNYVRCITTEVNAALEQEDPAFKISTQTFEEWIKPLIDKNKLLKTQNEIITIPVVIHVIHNGDTINSPNKIHGENISYAQAVSQINVLNQDFRRLTGSPGAQVSGYGLGVDTKIEFKLATIAPDGTATNGIDRVDLGSESWTTKDINKVLKPQTIWNPDKYFNMWVVRFDDSESDYLGYAQSPVQSGLPGLQGPFLANTDGVVANYIAFGTVAEDDGSFVLNDQYNRGRTITHEVGHWLGLIHIWGDGDCSKDDYCDDTPLSNNPTYECNFNKKSCNSIDMIENYMDYTDDICMNTFTYEQMVRMRTVLNNSPRRKDLKDAAVFQPTYSLDAQLMLIDDSDEMIIPCDKLHGIIPVIEISNRGKLDINSIEIAYGIEGSTLQKFEWKGNLQQFDTQRIELPIVTLGVTIGENKIVAEIIKVNNQSDEFLENNSATMSFDFEKQYLKEYKVINYTLEIIPDNKGSEISWEIKDRNNQTIVRGGPYADNTQDIIIEEIDLSYENCYTFIIYDHSKNGLCCGGKYVLKTKDGEIIKEGSSFTNREITRWSIASLKDIQIDKNLRLTPNPTDGIIYIQYKFKFDQQNVRVFNEIGQLMFKDSIKNNQLDLSGLQPGVYMIEIEDGSSLWNRKVILH